MPNRHRDNEYDEEKSKFSITTYYHNIQFWQSDVFFLALELVGPNYRSFITVMTCMFYTLGLVLLSGVTYYVRNWVYLALATSAPFTLYFIYWWQVKNIFIIVDEHGHCGFILECERVPCASVARPDSMLHTNTHQIWFRVTGSYRNRQDGCWPKAGSKRRWKYSKPWPGSTGPCSRIRSNRSWRYGDTVGFFIPIGDLYTTKYLWSLIIFCKSLAHFVIVA